MKALRLSMRPGGPDGESGWAQRREPASRHTTVRTQTTERKSMRTKRLGRGKEGLYHDGLRGTEAVTQRIAKTVDRSMRSPTGPREVGFRVSFFPASRRTFQILRSTSVPRKNEAVQKKAPGPPPRAGRWQKGVAKKMWRGRGIILSRAPSGHLHPQKRNANVRILTIYTHSSPRLHPPDSPMMNLPTRFRIIPSIAPITTNSPNSNRPPRLVRPTFRRTKSVTPTLSKII